MKSSEARKIGKLQLKIDACNDTLDKLQITLAKRPLVTFQIEGILFNGVDAIAIIGAISSVIKGIKTEAETELKTAGVEE